MSTSYYIYIGDYEELDLDVDSNSASNLLKALNVWRESLPKLERGLVNIISEYDLPQTLGNLPTCNNELEGIISSKLELFWENFSEDQSGTSPMSEVVGCLDPELTLKVTSKPNYYGITFMGGFLAFGDSIKNVKANLSFRFDQAYEDVPTLGNALDTNYNGMEIIQITPTLFRELQKLSSEDAGLNIQVDYEFDSQQIATLYLD